MCVPKIQAFLKPDVSLVLFRETHLIWKSIGLCCVKFCLVIWTNLDQIVIMTDVLDTCFFKVWTVNFDKEIPSDEFGVIEEHPLSINPLF